MKNFVNAAQILTNMTFEILKLPFDGFKQRGQISVLFALLMPIFLLFIGLALDLGWYYLNVSRLQNAADAAALAGAQKIIDSEENFSGYKNVALVSKYPAGTSYKYFSENASEQETIDECNEVAEKYVTKNLSSDNALTDGWTKTPVELKQQLYEKSDNFYYVVQLKEELKHFFLPGWFDEMNAPVTAVAIISKKEIAPDAPGGLPASDIEIVEPAIPEMPEIPVLAQEDSNVEHGIDLFTQLWLLDRGGTIFESSDGNIVVTSDVDGIPEIIKDKKNELGGYVETYKKFGNEEFIETNEGKEIKGEKLTPTTIGNWEDQVYYQKEHGRANDYESKSGVNFYINRISANKISLKGWNEYQALYIAKSEKGNYKTETFSVEIGQEEQKIYGRETMAGYQPLFSEEELESVDIDFRQDIDFSTNMPDNDWNLDYYNFSTMSPPSWYVPEKFKPLYSDWANWVKWWVNDGHQNDWSEFGQTGEELRYESVLWRIHGHVNFDKPFKVRKTRDETERINNPEDILWARIESEPMKSVYSIISSDHKTEMNSVRQIVLNINQSNMDKNYRPVVMFYDGPETINDGGKWTYVQNPNNSSETARLRDSQPVILNLNADFRGILFAPNSPVIILGNGKTLEGLVVAKKFVRLATEEDFDSDKYEWNGSHCTIKNPDSTDYVKIDITTSKSRITTTINRLNEYFARTDENGIEMIIDAWGNVQTRDLDGTAINYNRKDNARPNDKNYHSDETVYSISAFNLNRDSFYSTFNHSFLTRTDYDYMENYRREGEEKSQDMLFTTERAMWID